MHLIASELVRPAGWHRTLFDERDESAKAIARLLGDPDLRAEMSSAGWLRAEQFSWPRVAARVEEYYGFVIRRLAATGSLPVDYRAPVPQAPPVRSRPSTSSPAEASLEPLESASVSLQAHAE